MFRRILGEYGIEFAAAIPFSSCYVFAPDIIERRGVSPSELKTALLFLVPYYVCDEGKSNISVYSRAHDYHYFFEKLYEEAIPKLAEAYGARFFGFADKSAIAEVHAASCARLGKVGDSGLIINEKYGSYVFIGDIVTDIDPDLLGAKAPVEVKHCIGCGACRRACPTRILSAEGEDCLSAITQRKGELTDSEKALMRKHHTAWGCDLCQSACPYNKDPKTTPIAFFHRERIAELTRDLLDAMDKPTFMKRAFAWRGRKTVERNLDILRE